MSHSSIDLCGIIVGAQGIRAFLRLSICVKRGEAMPMLLLRSVGRIICGLSESYRCFVALLIRYFGLHIRPLPVTFAV